MEILKRRSDGESIVKIAQHLQVSRQYVSFVLNEAGHGGKLIKDRPAPRRPNDRNEQVQATVVQIEEKGEYTLAGLVQALARRRTAASPIRKAIKRNPK